MSVDDTQSVERVLLGIVVPLLMSLLGLFLTVLSFRGMLRFRDLVVERVYFRWLCESPVEGARVLRRQSFVTTPRDQNDKTFSMPQFPVRSRPPSAVSSTGTEAAPTRRLLSNGSPRYGMPSAFLRHTSKLSQPALMKWNDLDEASPSARGELRWLRLFLGSHVLHFHLWTLLVGLCGSIASFSSLCFNRLTADNINVQWLTATPTVWAFYATTANFIQMLLVCFTSVDRRNTSLLHGITLFKVFLAACFVAAMVDAAMTEDGNSQFDRAIDYLSVAVATVLGSSCVVMQCVVGNAKSLPRFILPVLAFTCGLKMVLTPGAVQRPVIAALGDAVVPVWVGIEVLSVLVVQVAVEFHQFYDDSDTLDDATAVGGLLPTS